LEKCPVVILSAHNIQRPAALAVLDGFKADSRQLKVLIKNEKVSA